MRRYSPRSKMAAWILASGALAACGKVVASDDDTPGGKDVVADASADASSPQSVFPDAGELPYLELDASSRTDATGRVVDAAACAPTQCDCDDDGFADVGCSTDAGNILSSRGEPLKPGDCDDFDPLRFPGQGFVAETPLPGRSGDWNCDGIEESWLPDAQHCTLKDGTCRVGHRTLRERSTCGASIDLFECGLDPSAPRGCGPLLAGRTRYPCR